MIACAECGSAFTFAVVKETDTPLIEFGRREVERRGLKNVTDEEIQEWADGMADTLDVFDVGDVMVYLDGAYWAVDSTGIEFDGYFASHKFDMLPHAVALKDPPHLNRVLGEPKYWFERELQDRE